MGHGETAVALYDCGCAINRMDPNLDAFRSTLTEKARDVAGKRLILALMVVGAIIGDLRAQLTKTALLKSINLTFYVKLCSDSRYLGRCGKVWACIALNSTRKDKEIGRG